MRSALAILLICLLLAQTGCSYALRKYNTPSREKLYIQTSVATNCVVRVVGADGTESFPVATDGSVTFDVARLPRGCDVHLLAFMKIQDGRPENVAAIHGLRNGKVVRKLSVTKLGKLPVDAEGYHILVLK